MPNTLNTYNIYEFIWTELEYHVYKDYFKAGVLYSICNQKFPLLEVKYLTIQIDHDDIWLYDYIDKLLKRLKSMRDLDYETTKRINDVYETFIEAKILKNY